MSTAPVPKEGNDEAAPLSFVARRRGLLIVGSTLALAIAVLVALLTIQAASAGEVSVLVGTLGSDRIAGLALIVALASLATGLCLIPVPRLWLILLVPARVAAITATCLSGLAWLVTSSATVVPLISAGCETGYVVEEESFLLAGWGTVYRTDGIFVTAVEKTLGDDGYHPFADGAYAVLDDGDSLRVWHCSVFDYSATPVRTDREPDFTLPRLTDRSFPCGLSTGARTPMPTPPPAPVYDIDAVRAGLEKMVAASLASASGPIHDAAGNTIDPGELVAESTACDGDGSRVGVTLEFATADNAASLAHILAAWDAAGYSPDRAIQEDIRYSETLPVQSMSIRDTTTIDGLIHMQITSTCATEE